MQTQRFPKVDGGLIRSRFRWCTVACVACLACGDAPSEAERVDAETPRDQDAAAEASGEGGGFAPPVADAGILPEANVAPALSPSDASVGDEAQPVGVAPRANRTEIVNQTRWERVDAAGDPFDDRPEVVVCDRDATLPEFFSGANAFGVDTAFCNYVTLRQATTQPVRAGESISVRLAHFSLTAPEASEAHVVVQIEELAILDVRIPIPSESQVLVRELVAPRDIPAQANVYLHVHNHGANSYALVSVSTGPT